MSTYCGQRPAPHPSTRHVEYFHGKIDILARGKTKRGSAGRGIGPGRHQLAGGCDQSRANSAGLRGQGVSKNTSSISAGQQSALGRLDDQVKIRGFRVELGEIESVLQDVASVDTAVAIGWPVTDEGVEGVVAFISSPADDVATIRRHCKRFLPGIMVPGHIYVLDSFPLNANGKAGFWFIVYGPQTFTGGPMMPYEPWNQDILSTTVLQMFGSPSSGSVYFIQFRAPATGV